MMKYIYLFLCLFLGVSSIYGQKGTAGQNDNPVANQSEAPKKMKKKSVMKEVKNYYKASNFSKVDEIILNTFRTYVDAPSDPDLLGYEMNTQYQLYLNENKKIFLNQKGDTTKFFNHIYKTYVFGLKCDSVSSIPNTEGKTYKKFSSDINNRLFSLRNNLKSGAMFHLKKNNFKDALSFFQIYIRTMKNPIVYKNLQVRADTDSLKLYYMALHSAYGAGQYHEVLYYHPIAALYSEKTEVVTEMAAQSAIHLGDTVLFLKLANKGFESYPDNEYFKANLIKYYHDHNDLSHTLRVLNRCIQTDSIAPKYWKLKGNAYYEIDSLDSAVDAYQHVVEIDKDDVDALSKLANIFLRKASLFYESANLKIGAPYYERNRKILSAYYQEAMSYYERIRALKPDDTSLWKDGLRETYYKLNKGKELEKLEHFK